MSLPRGSVVHIRYSGRPTAASVDLSFLARSLGLRVAPPSHRLICISATTSFVAGCPTSTYVCVGADRFRPAVVPENLKTQGSRPEQQICDDFDAGSTRDYRRPPLCRFATTRTARNRFALAVILGVNASPSPHWLPAVVGRHYPESLYLIEGACRKGRKSAASRRSHAHGTGVDTIHRD